MVGREMTDRFPKRPNVKIGDVSMEIKNWNVYHPLYTERKVVNNVSFKVHKGEVVGISGLMGAGRTELAMSIFGKSYGTKISGQVFNERKRSEAEYSSGSHRQQACLCYRGSKRKR